MKKKDGKDKEEQKQDLTPKKAAGNKKLIKYKKQEWGIETIEMLFHKGWITKIKFYDDLNYIVSSSLDGMIHIHKIDNLDYKGLTFNLHQKGVNSFVYYKTPM